MTEGRANQNAWDTWTEEVLKDHLGIGSEDCSEALPPCTVLVCTRDRPSDLRRCLSALCANVSEDVEIIVVDNDPPDEQARFVVSEFRARYVQERRRGLNWARARGVRLARHEVVLLTDDDVVVKSNWLNEMRRPFLEDHVGAVTGAVEPLELNGGQYLHEQYSSFYRGFQQKRYSLVTCVPPSAGQAGPAQAWVFAEVWRLNSASSTSSWMREPLLSLAVTRMHCIESSAQATRLCSILALLRGTGTERAISNWKKCSTVTASDFTACCYALYCTTGILKRCWLVSFGSESITFVNFGERGAKFRTHARLTS